ncbi:hypothetical protein GKZ28_06620 [Clostridium chromiireducens]|uniref:Uncharacterized protein n=1 Tax=Clostridium chromiireducens TaxID=225345 RepID=A0A964W1P8_9CLOT|nr:hypothetical protein [Clostridium chromiireducens]MVX63370.1 hypothetical protein [Clostridium chromiireducens]
MYLTGFPYGFESFSIEQGMSWSQCVMPKDFIILKEANDYMKSSYKNWSDCDIFADWANSVLYNRKSI